jgi:hypothetical protein
MNDTYNNAITAETKMPLKKVRSIMSKKNDYFFTAEKAIELFDGVEVGQVFAVKHQIVRPAHFGYAVHRKTDGLVDRHEHVHQQERYPARVDDE